jgi:hemerythrin superfamily protein
MNALDLLIEQHDEVEDLFSEIEDADDPEMKRELFEELADKVAAHAKIEETLFYPAVMAKQTEEILLESVEEHLSVKRVLADLMELDVDDESFDAKLSVMQEQIDHHAREEEEGELFPKVRKLFGADELEGLGGEMATMFAAILTTSPREQVPGETGEAAPLR